GGGGGGGGAGGAPCGGGGGARARSPVPGSDRSLRPPVCATAPGKGHQGCSDQRGERWSEQPWPPRDERSGRSVVAARRSRSGGGGPALWRQRGVPKFKNH